MSKKQPATEQHHKEQAAGNLQLGRRGFLHTGLLGAAAASAALAGPQRPTAEAAAGLRQRGATPIVDLEQPVDPQAVSVETWNDPWVWRPSDWPREQLHLNVVESQNPGVGTIPGNPNPRLFSYGGITPGPTIRMRGDETLAVKLRNLLEKDFGVTFVHEYPDPNELTPDLTLEEVNSKAAEQGNRRDDFCLGEHTNGLHAAHVTNLHTHGLHVSPGENSDGTHSDNIILRVLNQPDYRRRKQESLSPSCVFLRNPEQIYFLTDDEVAGEANYEFRIGNVLGVPGAPHPPGTHWYHPHAHGSTHNQVASGMAGFLIIEGDVDDRINQRMTGNEHPEPTVKSGPFDYRERLMLMQRVSVPSTDPDASRKQEQLRQPPAVLVNGSQQPARILMRPGAVERWRVLNGSVDGKGYRRFMVLNGQYGQAKSGALTKYDPETK